MLFTDLLFWSPWAGVSDLPRLIWCFIDNRPLPCLTCCCADWRMPCLTWCCATGAFLSHLLLCSLESAVSHLLPCYRRLPYLTCFLLPLEDALSHLLPGGCPVSPAAMLTGGCPISPAAMFTGGCHVSPAAVPLEAALTYLLPCYRRLPYLTCCLTAAWRMPCLTCFLLPLEDALSHLLPGGCPVSPAARRMPCLTCCPEDALSHLLSAAQKMPSVDLPVRSCRVRSSCLADWRLERPNMPSAHRTLPSLST